MVATSPKLRAKKKNLRRCFVAALLLVAPATTVSAAETERPSAVKDLHYGEVLFHFYQNDLLATLTQLQVAEQQGHLKHHAEEAKILEAGLYLNYGMQREAQRLFEALLDEQDIPLHIRNRAWFQLANIAFQKGHHSDAQTALAYIDGVMEASQEGRRQLLAGQVLIAQQRYQEAADLLQQWSASEQPELYPYALFNRAVALILDQQIEAGISVLEQITHLESEDSEQLALADKANLDIANTVLTRGDPARALTYFEKIRLTGPFASNALLGAGWAHVKQEQYEQAIRFWQALSERDTIQHTTQEALIGVPYAYSKIGALGTAAKRYEKTLAKLQLEKALLNDVITTIQEGALLDAVTQLNPTQPFESTWQLHALPKSEESQYLYPLLAGNPFREAVRNYLDLMAISATLEKWSNSIDAFNDILATRREGYAARVPQVHERLNLVDLDAIRHQYKKLKQHHEAINTTNYTLQLAHDDERKQWLKLADMEQRLKRLPDEPKYNKLRRNHRLLKGLLIWQLDGDYKARLWTVKKGLIQLERAIDDMATARESIQKALVTARQGFAGYQDRIALMQAQIQVQQAQTRRLKQQQAERVEQMAMAVLQTQSEALDKYISRAQFALAQIYDHAAAQPVVQPQSPPQDDRP